MLKGKKAVIFDLDGTLLNTMGVWTEVDRRLLKQLNGPTLSEREIVHFREQALLKYAVSQNPYEGLCAAWGHLCNSPLSGSQIHQLRFQISRNLLKTDVRAREGVHELIQYLKTHQLKLAIATCTKRANIDLYAQSNPHIAHAFNFERDFSLILTRDDITHTKPDPEIYLLALEKLGLTANECLVFEDSLSGVEAARCAGIDTVAIYESYSAQNAQTLRSVATRYYMSFYDCLNDWLNIDTNHILSGSSY